ncbi:dihydrolipoyl dehydrogenase [Capnocytophaga haemolytica]
MKHYDIVIIGSGPGGYVAAIRAGQLGFKTAIIEKYNTLGGTCLNVGCIPSKALLDSSHRYEDTKKHLSAHGISLTGEVLLDLPAMIARKQAVVDQTCGGVAFLMEKNGVEVLRGVGSFVSPTQLKISANGSEEFIEAKNVIIATGSKPISLPFIPIDKERVITSTEALSLKEVPIHLIVIGGGVIGLELGQVYRRLGAEVSIVEYADSILPTMDRGLGKELAKVFKKQGFKIYTQHQVKEVHRDGNMVTVSATAPNGETLALEGDYCLVSVGRCPYTAGLNTEAVGIKLDERGRVEVNEYLQTSVPNIYAIGDVVRGAMLAHKAEEEGVAVVEHLAGQKTHIDYNLIPGVVYTTPEVASVGKTEEQLQASGVQYKVGQFPMRALGRARASAETDGFVKVLADSETDEVLGVHIIGARAADMIAEAVVAMEYRASAEDIARICHAHPTFTEAIKEAALAATDNRALHI